MAGSGRLGEDSPNEITSLRQRLVEAEKAMAVHKQAGENLISLQKAVEASGEVVLMTDPNGTITYVNPEFSRVYGWKSEEVVGVVTPRILKSGRMAQENYEWFWRLILSKQIVKGEIVNKARDGRLVTVESSANPILDENNEVIGFLSIQRDVTDRKAMEVLLESLRLNEILLGSIPYPSMLVHRDRTVLALNKAAALIGVTVGSRCYRHFSCGGITGQPVNHPGGEDPQSVPCSFCLGDAVLSGGKPMNIQELSSGGRLWDMWWVPVSSDTFLHYAVDITERRQTEFRLRHSEDQLRLTVEQLPCVLWTTDKDLKYTSLVGAGLGPAHISPDEIVGKNVLEMAFVLKDGADNRFITAQRNALNGKASTFEIRIGRHTFFCYVEPMFDRSKEIAGVIGIALDITEKKHADEVARKLQAQVDRGKADFEMVLDSVADGVYVTDRDLKVTIWNPAAARITGWAASQVIGKSCSEFLCHRDAKNNILCNTPGCAMRRVLETGAAVNFPHVTANGADRGQLSLSASAAPVKDKSGNVVGMVQVFHDIAAEMEAERLKSALLANVSHELRTPLASIKGFTSTMLQPDVQWNEQERHDFLLTIDQECDRLTRLIADILDMSRLEGGGLKLDLAHYHVFDIVDAVSRRLSILTAHHQLQIRIPQTLPRVYVDEIRIGQVITNLVENAAKFSPEQTPIIIEAQQSGDEVIISVTDSGRGIPADATDKIFNRFFQIQSIAEGKKRGTGLGLSICRGILDAHGGRIWVESTLGVGSRFGFSLPLKKGDGASGEDSGH